MNEPVFSLTRQEQVTARKLFAKGARYVILTKQGAHYAQTRNALALMRSLNELGDTPQCGAYIVDVCL